MTSPCPGSSHRTHSSQSMSSGRSTLPNKILKNNKLLLMNQSYCIHRVGHATKRQARQMLRQCQVGNTSSRQITQVKQLGPWLALGWMGDLPSVEVDAVVKNTVKSQEWRNGASNINS